MVREHIEQYLSICTLNTICLHVYYSINVKTIAFKMFLEPWLAPKKFMNKPGQLSAYSC